MRTMKLVIATGLLVVMALSHALAHPQTVLDGDDSPGGLDLVAARQRDRARHVVLKLVTYETWTELGGSLGMTYVGFEFDLDGDRRLERCLEIGTDGTMTAYMYRDFRGCALGFEESKIGSREAQRPDTHSVKITIPKRWLGRGVKTFRWRAVTSFEEEGHEECPPPDPRPPERMYGTCRDVTRWAKHSF